MSATLETWPHVFEVGSDADAPPLLVLHGTGGDEHDLLPLARRLSPGSALFSPRGRVLENGMPRFFARFADGGFDPEDLEHRTDELAELIAEATEHYGVDPARLVAFGFSNGANIAVSLLLNHPQALAGALLLRPVLPSASGVPDLSDHRMFVGSGRTDPWAPPAHARRLVEMFESAGATVKHHASEAGHQLTQADLAAARDWFVRLRSKPDGSTRRD